MAFNFLGTFSTGQYKELESFLNLQGRDLQKRIDYLRGEIRRTGGLVVTFDLETGYIENIEASPSKSLMGKVFNAYVLQGGKPELELPIRSFNDPIYLPQGSAEVSATEFSNKRKIRNVFRFDSYIALIIRTLKDWVLDIIKFKREDLEFKMKKLMDWADQCAFEVAMLEVVADIQPEPPTIEEMIEKVGEAAAEWTQELLANLYDLYVEQGQQDPLKRMIVLTSLSDMLENTNTEVYSGDHPSVTINDDDVFGLGAGEIIEAMPLREGAKDPIPVMEK